MLASLAISCGIQTVYTQNNYTAVINRFIAGRAKSEGAEEYEDARKIVRADVNADGRADAAVLYTLEGFGGGNSYRQYLLSFWQAAKRFETQLIRRSAVNFFAMSRSDRSPPVRSISIRRATDPTIPPAAPARKEKPVMFLRREN